MLFTKDFSWDKAMTAIPVVKKANEKYYSVFAREMGKLYQKVQELDLKGR
jgi:hypothetical protein